ncbi:MAG: beta/gamma crystallin-related protein, partial [Promethearchaeota archaeon]
FFAKPKFQGKHHHVFNENEDLSNTFGTNLPSSMIIKSGEWEFYSEKKFKSESKFTRTFGPGMYDFEDEGINVDFLSVKKIADALPTEEINELILFEKGFFRGSHHHIFGLERGDGDRNLAGSNFDNITRSIIVISGIWGFFENPDFEYTEFNRLGPGMYATISYVAPNPADNFTLIEADKLTSVMLYKSTEKLSLNEILLFSDLNIQGQHHHVYCNDPNLNPSRIQNMTSSIVVVHGNWKFFGAPDFKGAEYWEDQTLGPGIYPDVTEYNIPDDVITSVRIGVDPPLIIAEPKPA